MPDIYMHNRFAKDLLKNLKTPLNNDLVRIGSQGPDPYYYLVFSNQKNHARHIGDRLHDTNVQTLLVTMTNYVKKHYSKDLYSYYVGFLMHFALDANVHPYVYHHVGIYDENNPSNQDNKGLHLRFERSIDTMLIQEDTKRCAYYYKITEALPLKKLPKIISDFYEYSVSEALNIYDAGELFLRSYKKMRFVLKRFVYDRTGVKYKLLNFLDRKKPVDDLFYKDLSFRNRDLSYDFLNRDHQTWYHPVTKHPSKKSVDDLYADALFDAERFIKQTALYIFEDQPIDFNHLFKNRSFNSGVSCDDERPMQFFQIYTEK
ncbi:MAG: zinc dependent phospholipase C family protein [Candidatus Izemoplasmataceae bacterium]